MAIASFTAAAYVLEMEAPAVRTTLPAATERTETCIRVRVTVTVTVTVTVSVTVTVAVAVTVTVTVAVRFALLHLVLKFTAET